MRDTMTIHMDRSQGTLLRVLGMIERRGWTVIAMDMRPTGPDRQVLSLELERLPWHGGSLEVLTRHIDKLYCVEQVASGATADAETGWSPAPASLSAAAAPTADAAATPSKAPAPIAAPMPNAGAATAIAVGASS